MDILQFLKSINDGKTHEFKDKDLNSVLKGTSKENVLISKLKDQGLVDYSASINKNGHLTLDYFWITDKGKQYVKEHSKSFKFRKPFWIVVSIIVIPILVSVFSQYIIHWLHI